MNKHYLLVDLMSDYRDVMSYKELKEMTANHIVEDTLNNLGDESIVRTNTLLLEEMIKKEPTIKYIEEELLNYSYKIVDLFDLHRDLEDLKGYFLEGHKEYVGNISETIDQINRMVNNNG